MLTHPIWASLQDCYLKFGHYCRRDQIMCSLFRWLNKWFKLSVWIKTLHKLNMELPNKDEFRIVAWVYRNVIRKITWIESRDSICFIYFFLFQQYSENKNMQKKGIADVNSLSLSLSCLSSPIYRKEEKESSEMHLSNKPLDSWNAFRPEYSSLFREIRKWWKVFTQIMENQSLR